MIVDMMDARIQRFIGGLAPKYVGGCTVVALNKDIDISRIHMVAQNMYEFRHQQLGRRELSGGSRGGSDLLNF